MHAVLVRVGMALLLFVAALAGCQPSPEEIAACRQQFADYEQTLDDDGNPGSKFFTPAMAGRWDALYARVDRLAESASGDECPDRLRALKAEIDELESVLHKIDDYDVARMIRDVESDLARDDALSRAARNDYVLITLLRTMRERGADAQKVLAPLVARVDAAKPNDEAERAAAMVALYNTATGNAAFADFEEALESIRNYELDPE